MLPTSRTHPRLHRRNPRINFLIVTNHRCILKDSDFSSVSILKRSSEDSTDTPLNATMKSPSRIPAFHNGQIPGYFTFEVYSPKLDATIVIAMNSDKKVNGEQGINVLLRDSAKSCSLTTPSTYPSSNRRTVAGRSG